MSNDRELVTVVLVAAPIVLVIGLSALAIGLSRQVGRAVRMRKAAITALCQQRGMVPADVGADFAALGAFSRRWLSNAYASPDHAVAVADFIRPAGNHTQYFTLLTFTVAGVNMPYVSVVRRILGGIFIGGPPNLELESIDFDKRFMVRARDRRSAVMLLDPGMGQLLLDCELVNFQMVGDKVLAFINRASELGHRPTEPVEFEQLFRFHDGFLARMPQLLRTEYGKDDQEPI